jgi:hypothetical protein
MLNFNINVFKINLWFNFNEIHINFLKLYTIILYTIRFIIYY